jgi:hypothetical protein
MEVAETGGAVIGRMRATWPLANIKISEFKLELNASFAGTFVFRPGDISSIVPCSGGSLLTSGIKINHTVPGYNANIVFGTRDPVNLIRNIQQTGFLNNKAALPYEVELEINDNQILGAFPFKISAIIIIVGIWNLLFLSDLWRFYQNGEKGFFLGIGAEAALGFMLLVCILLLILKPFSRLLLKNGREINSIKTSIYLLMFISIFILFGLSVFSKIIIR